jgi:prepilin-type N-terminal cleavage/methylation domain-containing protein
MKQISFKNQKGFTLIELMVSLTLFVIVVLAAVSSLYAVNNASRKVNAMRSVLDNLNFAMESMSRTIRTGSKIVCGGVQNSTGSSNCAFNDPYRSASDTIMLDSTLGLTETVEYSLERNGQGMGQIVKRVNENGSWSKPVAITAPEIDVQKLSFFVDGADGGDTMQPNVTIMVQGVANAGTDNIAPFAVQTFVSQRAVE